MKRRTNADAPENFAIGDPEEEHLTGREPDASPFGGLGKGDELYVSKVGEAQQIEDFQDVEGKHLWRIVVVMKVGGP
jgi:hypothetical protein